MNKIKKALTYMVGAMVVGGVSAYMAMPKEARQNLKDMIGNLAKGKKDTNN